MLTFPETGDDEEYATPSRVSEWNCVIEALVSDLVKVSFEQIFLMTCFKWRKKVYFIQVYRPVKQLVKQDLLERTALHIATQFWD